MNETDRYITLLMVCAMARARLSVYCICAPSANRTWLIEFNELTAAACSIQLLYLKLLYLAYEVVQVKQVEQID